MRRAVLYLQVSTDQQTTMNQERELRTAATRMGCEIVAIYTDQGLAALRVATSARNLTHCARPRRAGSLIS